MTYEMLLGEPPFTGPTAQSIVAKVMTEKPVPLIARRERIPPQVEDAVLTALEKLPADRFGSAARFADALTERSRTARANDAGRKAQRHAVAPRLRFTPRHAAPRGRDRASCWRRRTARSDTAAHEWRGELLGGPRSPSAPRSLPTGSWSSSPPWSMARPRSGC
jgi:serine/threonine protein kinase